MLTVSLSGLRFFAPIGLFPQEKALKNEIEVQLSVSKSMAAPDSELLDYGVLYAIVSEEMQQEEDLLESVIKRIVTRLEVQFPGCHICLALRKLHPPFGGRLDYAEVKWETPAESKGTAVAIEEI